ncbi:MAG: MFS transporter [Syntrophorhabdaceae bacterium]|nr:MFS transporter [Syntrophorhabdaceae bacterium]
MQAYGELKGKALLYLIFFWFVWFMNYGCRTAFSPIMPLLEDEYGITHAKASSLFALTSAGYGISLFVSGMVASLIGYKRSIGISLGACSLILFAVPFMTNFNQLSLLGFALGIATGMHLPSIMPIITRYYESKIWGKVLSLHDTGITFGVFVIPFIALLFLNYFNWRVMFYFFAGIFVLCLAVFYYTCDDVLPSGDKRIGFVVDVLKSKSLWFLGIVWIFAVGANLAVYFILPLYLTKELNFSIGYANTVFGFSRLGGPLLTIAGGFIIDRFNLKKTMFYLVSSTGLTTMLLSHKNPTVVLIFLFLQASFIPVFFPAGLVAISRMFDIKKRSMAAGVLGALSGLFGVGLLPYLLGLAGDLISFRFGIFVLGILVTLSSGLILFLKEID